MTQDRTKILLKLTLGLFAVLLLFAAVSTIRNSVSFRVTGTLPSGTLPTSTAKIRVEFSKELAPLEDQDPEFVQFTPELEHTKSIEGKTLEITLLSEPEKDADLKLLIRNARSASGSNHSTEITYSVKYIQFGDLSPKERELQETATQAPTADGFISQLPYETVSYNIRPLQIPKDPFSEEDDDDPLEFGLYIETIALRTGKSLEEYKQTNLRLRERALEWIRSEGKNPDAFFITYGPSDEELNGEVQTREEDTRPLTQEQEPEEEFTGDGTPPDASFFE